uniref:G_PROTEIN_RECEP_F1_2 domain-containing protein n=1 Tax=Steinernema glaseri TaxID=37863 RepID=A0A1I7Y5U4_9BILA
MERRIVIIEFCIAVVLSTAALCFLVAIFRKKSLVKIWKQSPGLSLFLGSITVCAACNVLISIEWLLFACGVIENAPHNTVLLITTTHVAVIFGVFHNCATVALFAQRVHYLLYPTKNVKKFNYVVLGILGIFCIVAPIIMTYVLLHKFNSSLNPVPEGCFSFNCTSANTTEVRICTSVVVVFVTCVVTLLGSYMIFLYHKYRKRKYSVQERKTNTFTLYVFYVRFVCTTVPFICELVLSATIWKKSAGLCLFLGSITLLSVFNGFVAIEWILFAFGVIENAPHNTVLIIAVNHVTILISQFHNCAVIVLFSQRVHYLLFPMKKVNKFNYIVLTILGPFWIGTSIIMTYVLIFSINFTLNPVPEGGIHPIDVKKNSLGCFAYNCTSPAEVRVYTTIAVVSSTCGLTVAGSFMVYLYHKYKKRNYSAEEKKTNTFTLYAFYVRFICITVPFICEFLLSTTARISLAKIIGPYGATGAGIYVTLQVLAHYLITSPEKVVTIAVLQKVAAAFKK